MSEHTYWWLENLPPKQIVLHARDYVSIENRHRFLQAVHDVAKKRNWKIVEPVFWSQTLIKVSMEAPEEQVGPFMSRDGVEAKVFQHEVTSRYCTLVGTSDWWSGIRERWWATILLVVTLPVITNLLSDFIVKKIGW